MLRGLRPYTAKANILPEQAIGRGLRLMFRVSDNAKDVQAFAKLPRAFGFAIEYTDTAMNLRNYEPD